MNLVKQTIDEFASLRRRRGWTTRIAAKKIGVAHPSLANILNYRRLPSREILEKMFAVLIRYELGRRESFVIKQLRDYEETSF